MLAVTGNRQAPPALVSRGGPHSSAPGAPPRDSLVFSAPWMFQSACSGWYSAVCAIRSRAQCSARPSGCSPLQRTLCLPRNFPGNFLRAAGHSRTEPLPSSLRKSATDGVRMLHEVWETGEVFSEAFVRSARGRGRGGGGARGFHELKHRPPPVPCRIQCCVSLGSPA